MVIVIINIECNLELRVKNDNFRFIRNIRLLDFGSISSKISIENDGLGDNGS